ncbi:hypothetical protein DPMN_179831 [Dreissena polymorpha]|uniref:Uncharacterized protein n=1 Tax=Dreissena polymorpha TaxID=45954 RepID=A0A9D4EF67_DREPO|nr:hypothetical protein DPMN_179831 [Dreissena polymorpha]
MSVVAPEVGCLSACKAGARGNCSSKPGGNPVSRTGCSSGLPMSIDHEYGFTFSNSALINLT